LYARGFLLAIVEKSADRGKAATPLGRLFDILPPISGRWDHLPFPLLSGVVRMHARMTLLMLALLIAPAAAEAPPACWTPSELAHRQGEEHVRKGVKQARIAPPQRTLADYSPIPQRGVVRRVKLPAGQKLVALTFDLCEQPSEIAGYQGGMVDFLRQSQVKATFFMGGKWMLSHRDRAQQLITDPLFEVANHGWEHRNLRTLQGKALTDEIKNAQLAYEEVRDEVEARQCTRPGTTAAAAKQAPKRLGLMRFPYGACNAATLSEAAQQGLLPIQWDVSSGDPTFGVSAHTIERQVLANVQPGSIVLFHANGRGWHTAGALPGIIAALKAQGYAFVTVSELMAAGEPVMAAACYDSRPGDTDRWPLRPPVPVSGLFGLSGNGAGGAPSFPWPSIPRAIPSRTR
jgi:peptidoglycan-N-acetylglucosamine deacetylase